MVMSVSQLAQSITCTGDHYDSTIVTDGNRPVGNVIMHVIMAYMSSGEFSSI